MVWAGRAGRNRTLYLARPKYVSTTLRRLAWPGGDAIRQDMAVRGNFVGKRGGFPYASRSANPATPWAGGQNPAPGKVIVNPYGSPAENPLILAPMAEITHAPFRMLVRSLGGCDVFFTEMLSARTVARAPQLSLFLVRAPEETDLVHQLLGADPDMMGEAADVLSDRGVSRIDLNMGCSAPPITQRREGAALLADPSRAEALVRAVRSRFAGHLSLKMRIPEGDAGARTCDFARRMVDAGIQTIALHGRYPSEKFRRTSRWDVVKLLRERIEIPVVGNGDIFSPAEVRRRRQETGGALMIGRGAAICPWIFAEAKGLSAERARQPMAVLEMLAAGLEAFLPEERHMSRFKIFLYWFAQSVPFGHALYKSVQRAQNLDDARRLSAAHFESLAASGDS